MNKSLIFKSFFGAALIGALLSCSREQSESSKLKITLPQLSQSLQLGKVGAHSTSNSGSPWSGSISSFSDINCYVLMVGGPTPNLSGNFCKERNSTSVLYNFGPFVGAVPAGGQMEIEVPSGPNRTFHLLGMQANAGHCVNFQGSGPAFGEITYPRLVASATVNLSPGEQNLEMVIPSDISNKKEIDECQIFDNNQGTEQLFGDARDGDLTINASGTFNLLSTQYNNGSLTHSNGSVASTKYFSSARQITDINVALDGKTLTLDGATITNDEFEVGDEILWIVQAGSATSAPDTNACGGDLYRGRWEFSKITAVDTANTKITIEEPLTPNYSSIQTTNLTATNVSGTDFCRIQVVRVANLDTLHVSGGVNATLDVINFDSGKGGVIAFRAKNLIIDAGATLNITASGKGFKSTLGQGEGIEGAGNTSAGGSATSNASGGGGGSAHFGAGGANAGAGGNSASGSTASGGQANLFCGGQACFTVDDKKIFLGGGGGGSASSAGGDGGGAIFLHIEDISGSGALSLEANGVSPTTANNGGGGGGGGSIHLSSRAINGLTTMSAHANGGNGYWPGSAEDGGGGGAGTVELLYCDASSSVTPTTTVSGGLAGNSIAQDGGNGASLIINNVLCN